MSLFFQESTSKNTKKFYFTLNLQGFFTFVVQWVMSLIYYCVHNGTQIYDIEEREKERDKKKINSIITIFFSITHHLFIYRYVHNDAITLRLFNAIIIRVKLWYLKRKKAKIESGMQTRILNGFLIKCQWKWFSCSAKWLNIFWKLSYF